MKTVFINIPEQDKKAGVENICRKLGISVRKLASDDAEKTLISIISGGRYELNAAPASVMQNAVKEYNIPEVIIFQGFEDDSLQEFLKAYKDTGLAKIPLKAVVTPYNIAWKLKDLSEHLIEESGAVK